MGHYNSTKPFATQRESRAESYAEIEKILETGPFIPGMPRVFHRARLLYAPHWWSQCGARITEMNGSGWIITSVELPKNLWEHGIRTGYRLDSKPLKPGQDWYVAKTGHARPEAHPWKEAFSPKRQAQPDCNEVKQPSFQFP